MNNELQKQILQVQKDSYNMVKKPLKDILKAYKSSLDDVQKEIVYITKKYEIDGVLNISSQQRYSVLKSLEKQLIEQAQKLGELNVNKTTDLLTEVFKESYYSTAFIIDKGIDTAMNFSILKPEFIKAAINTPIDKIKFSDRIWDNQKKLVDRVYKDVSQALVSGKSTEKLARQIKKDFGSSSYEAARLINTETARAMNIAQEEIYQNSDVVKQVMWDATLDNLTADEDASLDGKMWDKNDFHPNPPLHPNCRCCLVPVVEGWQPKNKVENIVDPKTGKKTDIDYTDYKSWKQSRNI